ncbi:unnamed protein product [Cyprideis torosa]|uniref:Uncharacterized protein n=1 Tax=Cyprideis torosa TaxID=163714 RepID=A0A7R8ZMX0_9CRUS|nr:unnamed protein product [Cyprideis torosa]CAG0894924.1 unnamed protein product [Cyprideis torosa]
MDEEFQDSTLMSFSYSFERDHVEILEALICYDMQAKLLTPSFGSVLTGDRSIGAEESSASGTVTAIITDTVHLARRQEGDADTSTAQSDHNSHIRLTFSAWIPIETMAQIPSVTKPAVAVIMAGRFQLSRRQQRTTRTGSSGKNEEHEPIKVKTYICQKRQLRNQKATVSPAPSLPPVTHYKALKSAPSASLGIRETSLFHQEFYFRSFKDSSVSRGLFDGTPKPGIVVL